MHASHLRSAFLSDLSSYFTNLKAHLLELLFLREIANKQNFFATMFLHANFGQLKSFKTALRRIPPLSNEHR